MFTQEQRNLAWHVQEESKNLVVSLIKYATDITGKRNVVIAGGYGLNCVSNYQYLKEFPNLNFYVDPVSHDGGTAIGYAKYAWYKYLKDNQLKYTKDSLNTLYLGPSRKFEIERISLPSNFSMSYASYEDVAKLLKIGEIVTIFQSKCEAGPRALGNRSILFDPRVINGKDIINGVKHREWFRPFAGSVLEEHASQWFDLQTLTSSPFMMYAVDVLPDKRDMIPSITHVDGTCRIQTVNRDQNLHYYRLIEAFFKLTKVPILFNTSFNLAGDPLVETIDDAIDTLKRSDLKYIYLPEINKIITKEL
jgi:carbamoyltransferase